MPNYIYWRNVNASLLCVPNWHYLAQDIPIENNCQPTFYDIQHSVLAFSGFEMHDANKWLSDFERAFDSVDGNPNFRLKCFRRFMKPPIPIPIPK